MPGQAALPRLSVPLSRQWQVSTGRSSAGLAPGPRGRVPLRPRPLRDDHHRLVSSEPQEKASPARPAVGERRSSEGRGPGALWAVTAVESGLRGEGQGPGEDRAGGPWTWTPRAGSAGRARSGREGEQVLEQRPPDHHGLCRARTSPPGAPHSHANTALVPLKGVCVFVRMEPAGTSLPQ